MSEPYKGNLLIINLTYPREREAFEFALNLAEKSIECSVSNYKWIAEWQRRVKQYKQEVQPSLFKRLISKMEFYERFR